MDLKIYASEQTGLVKSIANTELLTARNCTVSPKYSTTNSQALGIGGAFESDGWISKAEVNGDIETELNIDQFKLFMESAGFGTKASAKKPHDLEFIFTPNQAKYLTITKYFDLEKIYDTAVSCLVSSIKLNTTLQGYVMASISMIGMNFETTEGTFTPTMKTHSVKSGALKCLGTLIKENNTDITSKVESVDVSIDRKLEGKGALNSIFNKAIKPNGKGEVTLNLQFNEFDKLSYKTAQEMLKNNTSYTVEVILADDLDETRTITLKFPKVKISNVEATDLEGTGGMSKEMKAYTPEGKVLPFEITIVNYTK